MWKIKVLKSELPDIMCLLGNEEILMSQKGGKRPGAGRPSRGLPTTKVTVYEGTREILNKYSKDTGIPVAEIMYKMVHHKDFDTLINFILKEK